MKTRRLVSILIVVLAVLIIAGSCATSKKVYISEDNLYAELTGIWNNEEYERPTVENMPQVTVHSDGSFEEYKEFPEMTTPTRKSGRFITIKEAWTDSKGNTWYQAQTFEDAEDQMFYEIGKISDSGNVWEAVWSTFDYPDEIDSEHFNYSIRYRQE